MESHLPPPEPDDRRVGAAPNGGTLFAPDPAPVPPRAGGTPPRVMPIVAAILLLVASALLGFGTRDGWFAGGPSAPSGAGVLSPDSSATATVDDSSGTGVDTGAIAANVAPAIVNIVSITDQGVGAGTGMIISSNGLVLTNHHVISGARELHLEVEANGENHDAHVVGYAIDDDVALVQIEGVSGLSTIAPQRDVLVDDGVLVLGNAGGHGGEPKVSEGHVVALGEQITATDQTGQSAERLEDMIRIAAPVQPGQSGGAVVNADGQVVGMTTAAATNGRFRLGFGDAADEAYAIPIARALSVVDEIQGGESTDSVHVGPRAILGVEIQGQLFPPSGPGSETGGVTVSGVTADGPADGAGLTEGSTIIGIGGTPVATADDITRAMNRLEPDDRVEVTWLDPSGERTSATVRLAEGPPL
jgi:S1-C subfamily serine protease